MTEPANPRVELRVERRPEGTVGYITLANETKLNTLNRALMTQMIAAAVALRAQDDLRAVVLRGAGSKAFIGGANITEMSRLDPASARDFITLLHEVCDSVRRCPVPVIARIDGFALGAGLEVAASCDFRISSDRAKFGMPETKVGIPSVIEAALLPRLVGDSRARELVMLGEIIDASTALSWGLVNRVVTADELDAEVEKMIGAICAAGARAVRLQKSLMREWENLPLDRAIAAGIGAFARAYESDEPTRMMSGFLNRKRD